MATVYACDTEIIDPVCDPCLSDVEHGRIRAIAYIHQSVLATILAALTPTEAQAAWLAGIAAKTIYIIPAVIGTSDGGSPTEVPGYGDQATRVSANAYVVNYLDPAYKANCGFYNTISKSPYWHLAYKTETQVSISDKPVSIQPKAPITDDVTSEVTYSVDVKWSQEGIPCPVDAPEDVFVCVVPTT